MIIPEGEALASLPASIASVLIQATISTAAVTSPPSPTTRAVTTQTAVTSTLGVDTVASAASSTAAPMTSPTDIPQCEWPGCWYDDVWAGPLMWLILCYCVVSAFVMFALWCGGYLDWKLNLRDPYRDDPYSTSHSTQPQATNDFWYYQQNQYQQRQRDRAAARGDPSRSNFDDLQRRYAAAGIHVSTRELRHQLRYLERAPPAIRTQRDGASPDTLDELRALERERRDAIVIANLRRQGLM